MLTTMTIFPQSTVLICTASFSDPKPSPPPPPPAKCPSGYFGQPPECKCFEDNTAYFGNNAVVGADNRQPSRAACQRSCAQHPTCAFWTWGKVGAGAGAGGGAGGGPCYLKTARENVSPGLADYVSGSKHCALPEQRGNHGTGRGCMIWYNRNILKYSPY